jgi:uncharacterized protein (DUF302 family)
MNSAGRQESGVVTVRSTLTQAETVRHLVIAVERRGMIVFARIDHAKTAEVAKVKLRPALLFVFGYPDAEAPLIQKNPLFGLDFPQRMLVWEDEHNAVWISYNDPLWLCRRHATSADIYPRLEAVGQSLAGIAAESSGAGSDFARL